MIGRAWLVQSLLLSGDALKEENGTPHKIVIARGKKFSLATHIFKVEKDPFKKRNFRLYQNLKNYKCCHMQDLVSH